MAQQRILCQLEHFQGLLTCHRWEILEKVVKTVPSFEIIDEGFHRHPGPFEHGCTPENMLGAFDHCVLGHNPSLDDHRNVKTLEISTVESGEPDLLRQLRRYRKPEGAGFPGAVRQGSDALVQPVVSVVPAAMGSARQPRPLFPSVEF